MWRHLALWTAIAAMASAVLWIKASNLPPIALAWMRLVLAAAALTPLFLLTLRRSGQPFGRADVVRVIPGAILLALHFVTWIIGVRLTTAANASLIVNLSPVVMPFAMYLAERERLVRRELLGTILAIAGLLVLTLGGAEVGEGTWRGDATCAVSMLFMVAYMVFARLRARGRPIWLYVVPLYWLAAPVAFVFGLRELGSLPTITLRESLLVLGLALVPTVIGHSIFQWAMVHLRSQVVAISNLGQFVFAGIFAALLFNEYPAPRFYLAAALIAAGAAVVIRAAPPRVGKAIEQAQSQAD